jgi:11beta/17beta-hydroxysteroid dehydrogenase
MLVSITNQVQVSTIPVATVRECAEAIVNGACRGERYLTHPAWFKVTYFWKAFCPEVIERCYRLMYISRPGTSDREAPSKKILDLTGAKNTLYPSTLHTPDIKTD